LFKEYSPTSVAEFCYRNNVRLEGGLSQSYRIQQACLNATNQTFKTFGEAHYQVLIKKEIEHNLFAENAYSLDKSIQKITTLQLPSGVADSLKDLPSNLEEVKAFATHFKTIHSFDLDRLDIGEPAVRFQLLSAIDDAMSDDHITYKGALEIWFSLTEKQHKVLWEINNGNLHKNIIMKTGIKMINADNILINILNGGDFDISKFKEGDKREFFRGKKMEDEKVDEWEQLYAKSIIHITKIASNKRKNEAEFQRSEEKTQVTTGIFTSSMFDISKVTYNEAFSQALAVESLDQFVDAVNRGVTHVKVNTEMFNKGSLTIDKALKQIDQIKLKNLTHLLFHGGDHQHDFLANSIPQQMRSDFFPEICKQATNLKVVYGDIAYIKLIEYIPQKCIFWAYQDSMHTVVPDWRKLFFSASCQYGRLVGFVM
jgi:hypothetical protein